MRLPDSMFLLKEHPNTTQRRDGKLQPGEVKITMTIGARPLLEGELRRPISNPPLLTHRGLYSDMAETGPEAADLFSALGCSIRRACMARDRGPAPATAPLPPPTSPSASYLGGLPSAALLCAAHWGVPSTSHTTSSKTNSRNTTTRATGEVSRPDRVDSLVKTGETLREGKHTFPSLRPPLRRAAGAQPC